MLHHGARANAGPLRVAYHVVMVLGRPVVPSERSA